MDAAYMSSWWSVVYSKGFNASYVNLKDSYNKRAELLQKFGKLTTQRLQQVRKLVSAENLKKKDMSRDKLYSYLLSRPDVVDGFYGDLTSFVPHDTLYEFAKKEYLEETHKILEDIDVIFYIKSKIWEMYSQDLTISKEKLRQYSVNIVGTPSTLRIDELQSKFDHLLSRVETVRSTYSRYNSSSSEADKRRLNQLLTLIRLLSDQQSWFEKAVKDPAFCVVIRRQHPEIKDPVIEVTTLYDKVKEIRFRLERSRLIPHDESPIG
jgi:hypothetical protein